MAALALALVGPAGASAALTVSLDFDDGAAEAYGAGALLEQHNMRGTFYVNSGLAEDPGYMTWEQIADLQRRGHEIAGHTRSHSRLAEVYDTVGAAEVRRQVCGDRLDLRRHGFDVTEFAYPYGSGAGNDGVKAIVGDCGYRTGRSDHGLPNISATTGPFAELIPPDDPYNVRIPPAPMSTTPLSTLQGYVTRAEAENGWVKILFHRICDGCRPYSTPEPVFRDFLDWLATRVVSGAVVVKPVRQVMDEYWAFDKVAPETTIGPGPAQVPLGAPAKFEFSSSEEVSSFDCRIDAGPWEACYSPNSYTGLTEAVHTFAVRATDRGRNTDATPASVSFTVGNPPPQTVPKPAPPPPPPPRDTAVEPTVPKPAPPPPPRDTTVELQLSAGRAQRALRQKGIVVWARCPAERCTAALSGTVRIPGAKRLQLRRLTRALPGGRRVKLTLRLTRRQLEQLARALRTRGARVEPTASVTVSVTDASRNRRSETVTIRLTR
ncbi:MAG: polysaccharide deacetylase family protein [Nocardioidaceae bacterium]